MKKILTVYTGGTICCASDGKLRDLHPKLAKRALLTSFSQSDSVYAKNTAELFYDSGLSDDEQTLSENMTLKKLDVIIRHIKSFDLSEFLGVIVLHGTDTLAYTAALFSFLFCNTTVPIMLVSGNRPPMDEKSNALANFKAAAELIMSGIAPNVYVPYKNSNSVVTVHLASGLMQCADFSDDFYSAAEKTAFNINDTYLYEKCVKLSLQRTIPKYFDPSRYACPDEDVLLIDPYTGLDYSRIMLKGVKTVVHGTYHSGTVCAERAAEGEEYSSYSVLYLAKECKKNNIPLFITPCKLDSAQYASSWDIYKNTEALMLNMTREAAYGKVIAALSCGLEKDILIEFMTTNINNEILS